MDIQRTDHRAKKLRQKWWVGSAVAATIFLAIVAIAQLRPALPSVDRSTVWSDAVKRGDMQRLVRAPGLLEPKEVRWIAAETNARVEHILVRPGARVERETVIMELTSPEVQEQVSNAEAAVSAARADNAAKKLVLDNQALEQRANLAQAHSDYESARLEAEAKKELASKGVIPAIQYRQIELTTEQRKIRLSIQEETLEKLQQNLRAQLEADRARLTQLEATFSLRRRQADLLHVRAGIDGVLQEVPVQEGQQLAAGTSVARIARPDLLRAVLRLVETQAKDVALDQVAEIDTRNGKVKGKVARIDPSVKDGTVQIDIDLVEPLPAGARPDLSVEGTIDIGMLQDVLYIARPAFGPPNSTSQLFRLNKDGTADRIVVELGLASANTIEVKRGLAVGDQVIISDMSASSGYEHIRLN